MHVKINLMTDAEWQPVEQSVGMVIQKSGIRFEDTDVDYLVALHLLHEQFGILDLHGALKTAYMLGRRAQVIIAKAEERA